MELTRRQPLITTQNNDKLTVWWLSQDERSEPGIGRPAFRCVPRGLRAAHPTTTSISPTAFFVGFTVMRTS
jgi:hypothetical protein